MRLKVSARFSFQRYDLYTNDVGLEGFFLTMKEPTTPHHLVHTTLSLPPYHDKLRIRGFVVRSVNRIEASIRGSVPGIGVHFYGSAGETKKKWHRFIETSLNDFIGACESSPPPAPTDFPQAPSTHPPTLNEDLKTSYKYVTPPPGYAWTPLPTGLLTPLPEHMTTPLPLMSKSSVPAPLRSEVVEEFLRSTKKNRISNPPFLYRISPRNSDEMIRFLEKALSKDGIVLIDLLPEQTRRFAVIAIRHPKTYAEFHVPGRLIKTSKYPNSTVVRFLGVTKRTIQDFRTFVLHGLPPIAGEGPDSSEETVLYEDAHETQGEMNDNPTGFLEVDLDDLLPLAL